MSRKYYMVGIGGTSHELFERYEDLTDAEHAAQTMAEGLAVDQGVDPETVSVYENDCTEGTDRGACPMGNDGAYWPVIEEHEENT